MCSSVTSWSGLKWRCSATLIYCSTGSAARKVRARKRICCSVDGSRNPLLPFIFRVMDFGPGELARDAESPRDRARSYGWQSGARSSRTTGEASGCTENERVIFGDHSRRNLLNGQVPRKSTYCRALACRRCSFWRVYFCVVERTRWVCVWLPSAMEKVPENERFLHRNFVHVPLYRRRCIMLIVAAMFDKVREANGGARPRSHAVRGRHSPCRGQIPTRLLIAFAVIALSGVGAYGPMGRLWAIPTETLPAKIVGSVMGLVKPSANWAYFASHRRISQ